jgi:hypothetical protein
MKLQLLAAAALAALLPWAAAQADMTLIRLTPEQYLRSIHDIFGLSVHVDENKVEPGFRDEGLLAIGDRKLTVGSAELERYETLAQQIAPHPGRLQPRGRRCARRCLRRALYFQSWTAAVPPAVDLGRGAAVRSD